LSEFQRPEQARSFIDRMPPELVAQLVEARLSGSHSAADMVEWLHTDPEHGDEYRRVTVNMLEKWFSARGYRAGAG
jgi:hypothetical protein